MRLLLAWMFNAATHPQAFTYGDSNDQAAVVRVRFVHHAHMLRFYQREFEGSSNGDIRNYYENNADGFARRLDAIVGYTAPLRFNVGDDFVPRDLTPRRQHFENMYAFVAALTYDGRDAERRAALRQADGSQANVAGWIDRLLYYVQPVLDLLFRQNVLEQGVDSPFSIELSFYLRHQIGGMRTVLRDLANSREGSGQLGDALGSGDRDLDYLWQITNVLASNFDDNGNDIGTFIDAASGIPGPSEPRALWHMDRSWLTDVLGQISSVQEELNLSAEVWNQLGHLRHTLTNVALQVEHMTHPEREADDLPILEEFDQLDELGEMGRDDGRWTPADARFHGIYRRARGTVHRLMELTAITRHAREPATSPVRHNVGIHDVTRARAGARGGNPSDGSSSDGDSDPNSRGGRHTPASQRWSRSPRHTPPTEPNWNADLYFVHRLGFEQFQAELQRRDVDPQGAQPVDDEQRHRSVIVQILPYVQHVLVRLAQPNQHRQDRNQQALIALQTFTMEHGSFRMNEFAQRGADEERLQALILRASTAALLSDEFGIRAAMPDRPNVILDRIRETHIANNRPDVSDASYVRAMTHLFRRPGMPALRNAETWEDLSIDEFASSLELALLLLLNLPIAQSMSWEQRHLHANELETVRAVWPARIPRDLMSGFELRLLGIMMHLVGHGDLPDP